MFIYSTTLMNNKLFQHYIFKISLYHLIRTLINLYHSWYFSTHSTLSILIKLVSTWMTTNIFRHIYSLCVRLYMITRWPKKRRILVFDEILHKTMTKTSAGKMIHIDRKSNSSLVFILLLLHFPGYLSDPHNLICNFMWMRMRLRSPNEAGFLTRTLWFFAVNPYNCLLIHSLDHPCDKLIVYKRNMS